MLWSLIKLLLFVAIVTALTFGAARLMEADGGAIVTVGGVEVTLSPLQLVIAFVVLVVAVWVAFKLIGLLIAMAHFLNGDETALSRYFSRNRERKGFEAMADGMMALASGEGRLALTKAAKAERYLDRPDLTNLLTAQAAEMAGDRGKAEETYKKLLSDDRTRFVGVRGIMKQRLADGDTDTALELAKRAFALKPRHEETSDVLLRLQAEKGDWSGARQTLGTKLKHGSLPRDLHRRRDAILAVSEAKEILETGADISAQEAAIEANRLSPDLIPAAVMAARAHIEQGNKRNASRIVKKTWSVSPHPDLAAAFAEIEPDESPLDRIKRFKTLVKGGTTHPEARMLMAELHIAAEDFPAARRALGDLHETDPTTRNLTIVAAIERGEGRPDQVVRGWLAKALTAPRGPQWVCRNCQHIHAEWTPVCSNCHSFDTLDWRTPPKGEPTLPHGSEMLPLIVGQIEDQSSPLADVAEIVEPEEEVIIVPAEGAEEGEAEDTDAETK